MIAVRVQQPFSGNIILEVFRHPVSEIIRVQGHVIAAAVPHHVVHALVPVDLEKVRKKGEEL